MAIKPIRVSQLNSYIKRVLQTDPLLGNVSVIGEISNLKFHGSGHIYFTLKDQDSKLNCFLPSDQYKELRYELAEGMEITAIGYIYVYERGGTYSLNIRDIEVKGLGNLSIAFEQLKEKLEREGLFDKKYKKQIPKFPKQVAIVTSETGAAVRDIIKIIKEVNNITNIIVYPCLVQGEGSSNDIAQGISQINELFPETDTIIVGRGGGSMEELWSFNEEIVARSIFLSEIPIISAVGHETDFTISDYVADRRAATPSEAAQIAVSDVSKLNEYIESISKDYINKIMYFLEYKQLRIDRYNIEVLVQQIMDRLNLSYLSTSRIYSDSIHAIEDKLISYSNVIESLRSELYASNPYEILSKGYGAILNGKGELAMSVKAFEPGDFLTVIFKDGKINCYANEVLRGNYGKDE